MNLFFLILALRKMEQLIYYKLWIMGVMDLGIALKT